MQDGLRFWPEENETTCTIETGILKDAREVKLDSIQVGFD